MPAIIIGADRRCPAACAHSLAAASAGQVVRFACVRGYDLSQDGQRFLMVKLGQTKPTPVTEMILVLNWFEELRRLVPTEKK